MTMTRTTFANTIHAIALKDSPHRWLAKIDGDLWLIGAYTLVRVTRPIADHLAACGIDTDTIELPAVIAKAKGAGRLEVVAQGPDDVHPPASIDRILATVSPEHPELHPLEIPGVARPMAELAGTLTYLYGPATDPSAIDRRYIDLIETAYPAPTWHQAGPLSPAGAFDTDGQLIGMAMPVRLR